MSSASKTFESIIIGGGISGLSCAKRLHEEGRDFLLITKDVGGRMLASKSFDVNFGAAYVTQDYKNVLQFVEKGEQMSLRDFFFFDGKGFSNLRSFRNFKHYPKIIKLFYFAWRIRNHINRYRKQAPYKSMINIFEKDPFLMKYWLMSADEFIEKHKLEVISHYFADPITAATAFVHTNEMNAVYLVSMVFPGILKSWQIDFTNTEKKLTKGYRKKIKIGSVLKVKKNKKSGEYDVQTSVGNYSAKNIVFAAPQKALADVYPLPKMSIQQDVYVFNIMGERRDEFKNKKAIIFQSEEYDINMIWGQADDSDIVYTHNKKPDFKAYYKKYELVEKVDWQPAIIIPTCCLIDQDLGDNLYFASDCNISGLEDSFLTGLYAANQIINNS